MCDTMHPALKIIIGALLVVLGVFSILQFTSSLLTVIQGSIGVLLILIGAFIIWLESDEWKLQQQEDRESKENLNHFSKVNSDKSTKKQEKPDYDAILDKTVKEIKQEIKERQDIDLAKLLKKEKKGKDRKTLKQYIKRQM